MRLHLLILSAFLIAAPAALADPLPGTKPLDHKGDLAADMVSGIDKYLMRELDASVGKRKEKWNVDTSSLEKYVASTKANRERLRKMLGIVEDRVPVKDLEYVSGRDAPALIGEINEHKIYAVRWPVLPGIDAEGLLFEPKDPVEACVVAIPDADQRPEAVMNLMGTWDLGFGYHLGNQRCRVLVPTLINRQCDLSGNQRLGRMTNQPHREFVYRMAYEMGHHVIGYEVQKVLAAVDYFCKDRGHPPVGIVGYGEGGLIALYAGAVDDRVEGDEFRVRAIGVSGYFGPREALWREPIYRNVAGLLTEFGDAELLLLTAHRRRVLIHGSKAPTVEGPPAPTEARRGAAPGKIETPSEDAVKKEIARARALLPREDSLKVHFERGKDDGIDNAFAMECVKALVGPDTILKTARSVKATQYLLPDPAARQKRQFEQLVRHVQDDMRDSEAKRAATFWAKLDRSSPEKYANSTEPFRKQLDEEVLGKLTKPTKDMNPRSREVYDTPKWKGYEVTLDLYDDVFAYGILLLPKDLKPGERRPVVVCQHGLEGRPQDVCNPKERTKYYNSFGAQLADLGYVVYAPQNPYIGQDKFRVLQRKANPLGLSLFSFINAQHRRTIDWLETQPFVDKEKIAFYGLSYGGKTAMRVPAVETRYCLSICSGDFNEWTWKNVSIDYRGSYMFSPEYEMPEFNLGHTLVYAEMAALIAPRPFMVERGHDDGVGIDEWVSLEYAKVRRHYTKLKIPEKTEIEYFDGGHEIHGKGTFAFLKKHLDFPKD